MFGASQKLSVALVIVPVLFSAINETFSNAQSSGLTCFSCEALQKGDLARLGDVMRKVAAGPQGIGSNLSSLTEGCTTNLADTNLLERNLVKFVISDKLIGSLGALSASVKALCTVPMDSKAPTPGNRGRATSCLWNAFCCDSQRNAASPVCSVFLDQLRANLVQLKHALSNSSIDDSSGLGSGSGSASGPRTAENSSLYKKLCLAEQFVQLAKTTLDGFGMPNCSLEKRPPKALLKASKMSQPGREIAVTRWLKVARHQVSRAIEDTRRACKVINIALSLEQVTAHAVSLDQWWCNYTGDSLCQQASANVDEGLPMMVCSAMLAPTSDLQCTDTPIDECCTHTRSLKTLATVVSSTDCVNQSAFSAFSLSLINELEESCKSGTTKQRSNQTTSGPCLSQLTVLQKSKTCAPRKTSLDINCPFPYIRTNVAKHWDSKGRKSFMAVYDDVLKAVFLRNCSPALTVSVNSSATIFPCALSCKVDAIGIPRIAIILFRWIDIVLHHIWLCVFIRAVYVMFLNWHKITGSQPHRCLVLCNASYATATLARLFLSYQFYFGSGSLFCLDDGSMISGFFDTFGGHNGPRSCFQLGFFNMISHALPGVGLSWACVIWYLTTQDMIQCRRTTAEEQRRKSLCTRLREDRRLQLEMLFIFLAILAVFFVPMMVILATQFVPQPLLNICMIDNWPQAFLILYTSLYLPNGVAFLAVHRKIETEFRRSNLRKSSTGTCTQANERILWYGERLRTYGISTLAFAIPSVFLVAVQLSWQYNANQSDLLTEFVRCHLLKTPGRTCPQFPLPQKIFQLILWTLGQFFCIFNISLLSWSWQSNLDQPVHPLTAVTRYGRSEAW